jgi:hypothetical protein
MKYQKFCEILNKHIFEGEKKELLKRIAEKPERFIGLFRPTKPGAKILQHILQSHEIRFGDAFEEIVEEFLKEFGFQPLSKSITDSDGKPLSLDQHFADGKIYYVVEQKVRDDHDSTKKDGQITNFEKKLDTLYKTYTSNLVGIMYFLDPDLVKNKNFYLEKLQKLSSFYGIKTYLFYGKELFEFFGYPEYWDQILIWLKQWKDNLPELPEIDFDKDPEKSFEEIKDLELRYWKKLLENEKLWKEGIIKAIFREGKTLRLLLEFFNSQKNVPFKNLTRFLEQKIEQYF